MRDAVRAGLQHYFEACAPIRTARRRCSSSPSGRCANRISNSSPAASTTATSRVAETALVGAAALTGCAWTRPTAEIARMLVVLTDGLTDRLARHPRRRAPPPPPWISPPTRWRCSQHPYLPTRSTTPTEREDPMTQTTLPAVYAEPTRQVTGRWIAFFAIAWLGIWMAQLAPIQKLLPDQVTAQLEDHVLGRQRRRLRHHLRDLRRLRDRRLPADRRALRPHDEPVRPSAPVDRDRRRRLRRLADPARAPRRRSSASASSGRSPSPASASSLPRSPRRSATRCPSTSAATSPAGSARRRRSASSSASRSSPTSSSEPSSATRRWRCCCWCS